MASSPESNQNVHQEEMASGVAMKGISMISERSFDDWPKRFKIISLLKGNGTGVAEGAHIGSWFGHLSK